LAENIRDEDSAYQYPRLVALGTIVTESGFTVTNPTEALDRGWVSAKACFRQPSIVPR
jgi:hypothetical protein